jgi:hypothetical protein
MVIWFPNAVNKKELLLNPTHFLQNLFFSKRIKKEFYSEKKLKKPFTERLFELFYKILFRKKSKNIFYKKNSIFNAYFNSNLQNLILNNYLNSNYKTFYAPNFVWRENVIVPQENVVYFKERACFYAFVRF